MSTSKINEQMFDKIYRNLSTGRLKSAINLILQISNLQNNYRITSQVEQIDSNYRMLLDYYFKRVNDPNQDTIYNNFVAELYEITDTLMRDYKISSGDFIVHKKQHEEYFENLLKEEALQNVKEYSFNVQLAKLIADMETGGDNEKTFTFLTPSLFRLLWQTEKYKENDKKLAQAIRKSGYLPWYEKCVTVSAITLSMISYFDSKKVEILCDFYDDRENEVWQRALTGIVIAMLMFGNRFKLYTQLNNRLLQYKNDPLFIRDTTFLIEKLLKSLETEKLSKQLVDEILPNVVGLEDKLKDSLKDKLNLEDLFNSDNNDMNPDWENIFGSDSDLINRMEKMSEMQLEGSDFFMGTFAQFKNYPFFKEISNWFRPFYRENPEINDVPTNVSDDVKQKLVESIENSFYICNSDKYSFYFNLSSLPPEQCKQIVSMLSIESEQLKEIKKDEQWKDVDNTKPFIFSQYIQDLYRFFKLHPNKNEFVNFFEIDWVLDSGILVELQGENNTLLHKAADFFFKNSYYGKALRIFTVIENKIPPNKELLEKIGFCYQQLNNFEAAVNYYIKVELFETQSVWTINKIVYCYNVLGNYAEALNWSKKAQMLQPTNPDVLIQLAISYSDNKMYSDAIDTYNKVLAQQPENKNVLRAIARCSISMGGDSLATARDIFFNLKDDDAKQSDIVYYIILKWITSDVFSAIDELKANIKNNGISVKETLITLNKEKQFILDNNVSEEEWNFFTDYMLYM